MPRTKPKLQPHSREAVEKPRCTHPRSGLTLPREDKHGNDMLYCEQCELWRHFQKKTGKEVFTDAKLIEAIHETNHR